MSRKKKILYWFLAVMLVVTVVGYVVANSVLDRVSRQAMPRLVAEAGKRGVQVEQPSFESVGLTGFLSATWSNLRADVKLQTGELKESGRVWELQADRLTLDWDIGNSASLDAQGITLVGSTSDPQKQGMSDRRIEIEHVSCQFALDLLDSKSTIEQLLPELIRLTDEGAIKLPLGIDGKIMFLLKKEPTELHLQAIQQGDNTALVLNHQDVAALSSRFDEKLTEAEVELIASHPLRAPRLLEIKDDAETTSENASSEDPSVPQDAYRHILWSHLLAQAYGADFAEQVGDAHETGDTGNTAAERQMDLHNNAIGRKYAEEEIQRGEILDRLLADPEVRRASEL